MKLTEVTANQLTDAGVSLNHLLESYNSGQMKRQITRESLTQGNRIFRGSMSHETQRNQLNDAEDYAHQIVALDQAFQKNVKLWGVKSYAMGDAMIKNCVTLWPYVKKQETVKA